MLRAWAGEGLWIGQCSGFLNTDREHSLLLIYYPTESKPATGDYQAMPVNQTRISADLISREAKHG